MKKIANITAIAALLVASLASCNDTPENIVTAKAEMYNIVVDEANLSAPATLTQDWSSFVIDFGRGKFSGDIKAQGQGVNVSFATGDMDMTIGPRSFEFSKGAIMAAGQDVTNLKGMYDNRTGALTIDYKVNGNYHVYSCESFAYNFCSTTKQLAGESTTIKGARFELVPDIKNYGLTVIIVNFRKSPGSFPVDLVFENIPFKIAHSGAIVGEKDTCLNTKEIKGDNSSYTATMLKTMTSPMEGKGWLQFDMDGAFYKIEGDVFTPVSESK